MVRSTDIVTDDWEECAYRIFMRKEDTEDDSDQEVLDIPCHLRDVSQYRATLAHKVKPMNYILFLSLSTASSNSYLPFVSFSLLLILLDCQVNHSFRPNCRFSDFHHPVHGPIRSVVTLLPLGAGAELTVHYNYSLEDCPEWYSDLWETGM